MKKVLTLALTVALTAALAIGGTVAYLTSEARNDNTMTLGNVKISQWEYERAKDEDGNYETKTIDNVNSYVLKGFTQDKALLPATEICDNGQPNNNGAGGWDETGVRMTQVGSYGSMQVFESPNAVDKFVTVKNEGKTDAYVRTIVATEIGKGDASLIGYATRCVASDDAASINAPWVSYYSGVITIDGTNYSVFEYVYRGASDVPRHKNGVLSAGQMTYPSLCQVYMKANATNEDVEALDGNKNGKLDILVLSQAVQADEGWADAQTALDAAFGDVNAANVQKWFAAPTTETTPGTEG